MPSNYLDCGGISPQQHKVLKRVANSFPLFVQMSLRHLGFEMANVQREMAEFLECGEERVCLMAARGYSKTYTICLYACWRWLRNPHLKVKVMSNSFARSKEITAQILHFLNRLPYTQHLKPRFARTSRTTFNINNAWIEKEPSLQSISVGSNQTGSRIDLLIADDVESEHVLEQSHRDVVLNSLREASSMLHPPATRPFYKRYKGAIPKPERTVLVALGTYATRDSLYITPKDGSAHFLQGATVRKWAALDAAGNSTFPERFSTEYLTTLRDKYLDRAYWTLQFLLDPDAIELDVSPFKMDTIRSLALSSANVLRPTVYVDPSNGKNDYMVAVVGGIADGKLVIQDVIADRDRTSDAMLADIVAKIHRKYPNAREYAIENNVGAFPELLSRALQDAGVVAKVVPVRNTRNKLVRVLENCEPLLHSGDCRFVASVLDDQRIVKEAAAWRYNSLPTATEHDDFFDAIAGWIAVNKDKLNRRPARIGDVMIA